MEKRSCIVPPLHCGPQGAQRKCATFEIREGLAYSMSPFFVFCCAQWGPGDRIRNGRRFGPGHVPPSRRMSSWSISTTSAPSWFPPLRPETEAGGCQAKDLPGVRRAAPGRRHLRPGQNDRRGLPLDSVHRQPGAERHGPSIVALPPPRTCAPSRSALLTSCYQQRWGRLLHPRCRRGPAFRPRWPVMPEYFQKAGLPLRHRREVAHRGARSGPWSRPRGQGHRGWEGNGPEKILYHLV